MTGALHHADSLLRARGAADASMRLPTLAMLIVVFGMIYGAVMGCFSATSAERSLQILFGAVKVPFMLLVTFALSLPSFFVLNTLMGLRNDFANSVRALNAIYFSVFPWFFSCFRSSQRGWVIFV